ncbi:MAG TPA: efflux RND transporter periplasmic adaptor subunit [Bacteroidales bacterium]
MKKIVAMVVTLAVMVGCVHKQDPAASDSAKFCIPDSLMNKITFDTVGYQRVTSEFNLIGKITYDQDKVVKLYPLVSGNVLDVKVALGDFVEKGETLAIVRSGEIVGAENDIVTARSNLAVAEKNLAATEDMYKSGIASEREYSAAQNEVEKAKSELNKANTILSIYGGKQSDYIVKSPISGYIVEKFVNPNMQIRTDNTSNLFTISDLKKIWVLANVYETDISSIKVGENVSVTTISYPDKVFDGRIDKIYNVLDPDSKTMKVRVQLDNPDYLLKPEMFANVTVHQVSDSSMLAVPAKAVIFDRDKNWVVIYNGKCDIQTRQIEICRSTDSYSYVRSGIKQNEKIVSNLQLLIYNALSQD